MPPTIPDHLPYAKHDLYSQGPLQAASRKPAEPSDSRRRSGSSGGEAPPRPALRLRDSGDSTDSRPAELEVGTGLSKDLIRNFEMKGGFSFNKYYLIQFFFYTYYCTHKLLFKHINIIYNSIIYTDTYHIQKLIDFLEDEQ